MKCPTCDQLPILRGPNAFLDFRPFSETVGNTDSVVDYGDVQIGKRTGNDNDFDAVTATATDAVVESVDIASQSDAWLLAAVRQDPPDENALNGLVARHWSALFGRCRMLTTDHQQANDLAQETWFRVLRARHSLKPDGNFPAYLATVATNLWRDANRSVRRAGAMARERMLSLDAELPGDDGGVATLADGLPDPNALQRHDQALLKLDIDRALQQLPPLLRDVLIARYLTGESCAEIGRTYGRTEQTISGWVREALRQIKVHFAETELSSRA